MSIHVGDRVQIKNEAIESNNGTQYSGVLNYVDQGPFWAKVKYISDENEATLINENGGIIYIGNLDNLIPMNYIYGNSSDTDSRYYQPAVDVDETPNYNNTEDEYTTSQEVKKSYNSPLAMTGGIYNRNNDGSNALYGESSNTKPTIVASTRNYSTAGVKSSDSITTTMGDSEKFIYKSPEDRSGIGLNDAQKSIGAKSVQPVEENIVELQTRPAWYNANKRREMQKNNKEAIQNGYNFPVFIKEGTGLNTADYDYQIVPNDSRLPIVSSLEDKLAEARAQLGIHVHGNNSIARAVKYYMYNRYKVPDNNLNFNKMTTHVFFTRPDLNLLIRDGGRTMTGHNIKRSTEAFMLYKKNPDLFTLLSDGTRIGDSNNFNFLLSNQVSSFEIGEEEITATEVGKSWTGYSIPYATEYNGRQGKEFSCTFDETQDLSVISLIKLWMLYIDNVSKGAWSPSYNLLGDDRVRTDINASYVYSRTLDYPASVYVFKCGPNGEDVLYWSKYYGVYPISNGTSGLSWNKSDGVGKVPDVSIKFRYAFKRDFSPISLIEFNLQSKIGNQVNTEASFDPSIGMSTRPFVGVPFIETNISDDTPKFGNLLNKSNTSIRLKFAKYNGPLSDDILYRSYAKSRTVTSNYGIKPAVS